MVELAPAGENPAVANYINKALERGYSSSDPAQPLGSLVMVSGGLDSVALLANLLTATNHKIHAHHIAIDNYENRSDLEWNALQLVMEYMARHYRPFTFSHSRSEFHLGIGGGLDMTLAMFTAGRVYNARGGGIDIVWTGHITSSTWEIVEGTAAFHASFMNKLRIPEWLRPLIQAKKKEIYESIPKELAELCWSCRAPVFEGVYYKPCEQCYTCGTIAQAGGNVAAQGGGAEHRMRDNTMIPEKNQGVLFEAA